MKKKNLKSLKLNKKSISHLNKQGINGGASIPTLTLVPTFTLGDGTLCDVAFPPGTVQNCTYAVPCDPNYSNYSYCNCDSEHYTCN